MLRMLKLTQLASYKILRKIGEGGFGIVYLAKREGEENYVALKVLELEKNLRESKGFDAYKILSNSENASSCIVPIIDSGTTDEYFYYAMPLADSINSAQNISPENVRWASKSLFTLIEEKLEKNDTWFTAEEILSYIIPIFDAAIFIGEQGLLHRDIKPDNILFFDGKAKLADIGLMSLDRPSLSNAGTPSFSAPLWYLNSGGNPDMYCLATTFYMLISGNLPDMMGRAAYQYPDGFKEKFTPQQIEQWEHWHRVLNRATAENSKDRFLRLNDFKNALLSDDFNSSKLFLDTEKKVDAKKSWQKILPYLLASLATIIGLFAIKISIEKPSNIPQENEVIANKEETKISEKFYKNIKENGYGDEVSGFYLMSISEFQNAAKNELAQTKENIAYFKKNLKKIEKSKDLKQNKKYIFETQTALRLNQEDAERLIKKAESEEEYRKYVEQEFFYLNTVRKNKGAPTLQ